MSTARPVMMPSSPPGQDQATTRPAPPAQGGPINGLGSEGQPHPSSTALPVIPPGQFIPGLIGKVQRKIQALLDRIVPIRGHLRPRAASETSAEYARLNPGSGVVAHVLADAYQVRVPVPKALIAELSPYFTYDRLEQAQDTEGRPTFCAEHQIVVTQVPGGRILTNNTDMVAILTADGTLLGDVSYHYNVSRSMGAAESGVFALRWIPEPTPVPGTVFNMLAGGGSTHNYGHWLIDALPRLHLLDRAGLLDQVDYVLVPAYNTDYHRDTLAMFGFGPERVIVAGPRMHLAARQVISSSHPRGNRSYLVPEWIVQDHRRRFIRPELFKGRYPERVYISRKDSSLRNVVNEDELFEQVLAPLGFVSYQLAKLPFIEKVALFASAKVVVSASGAGMNNVAFCPEGFTFIEIFPQGLVHTQFYNIAQYLGVDYYFMVCRPQNQAKTMREGLKEHTYVHLDEFRALLTRVPALQSPVANA